MIGCEESRKEEDFTVRVAMQKYPESLNPALLSSQESYEIAVLIFENLVDIDQAGNLIPVLADKVPSEKIIDSTYQFTYTLHPKAQWPDGKPVTAHDVAYTIKAYSCPLFENSRVRYGMKSVDSIAIIDDSTFEIYLSVLSVDAKRLSGSYRILPEHLMDSTLLLRNYTLSYLRAVSPDKDELDLPQKLLQFARQFNESTISLNSNIQGSGPYKLSGFTPGQSIRLVKREDYWANSLSSDQYLANPKNIAFYTLPEDKTALTALESKQIDIVSGVPVQEFKRFLEEPLNSEFHAFTPLGYRFVFLGLNTRKPPFTDPAFKEAIAGIIDKEKIIRITQQGFATPSVGPINPADSVFYNDKIPVSTYDVAAARKTFQSYTTAPELSLKYNAAYDDYEKIALWLQSEAKKAGLILTPEPQNISMLRKDLKNHAFDLFLFSFTGSKYSTDFRPIFGSPAAALGGMNYTGYGDAESDSLLVAINSAATMAVRAKAMRAFQKHLSESNAIQFLYFEKNKILISKRILKPEPLSVYPYYSIRKFQKASDKD